LNQLIRKLHRKYNNVKNVDDKYIIIGPYALVSMIGSLYAYGKTIGPFTLHSPTPYYFGFESRCSSLSGLCEFNSSTNLNSSNPIVELVSVPCNPSGATNLNLTYNTGSFIVDAVYNWPHLNPDGVTLIDAPVTLFSFTKLGGHASERFGWIFVSDLELALKIKNYFLMIFLVPTSSTLSRAIKILEYINNNGDKFFKFMKDNLNQRWNRLENLFNKQDNYIIQSKRGTQYAFIYCKNQSSQECTDTFLKYNLITYTGSIFGSKNHTRLNMMIYDYHFELMMKRLEMILGVKE